jgi:hypothetical protein
MDDTPRRPSHEIMAAMMAEGCTPWAAYQALREHM